MQLNPANTNTSRVFESFQATQQQVPEPPHFYSFTSSAPGVLIDAMRKGYWIILDELNLAPTDVLEALNRLLDDNRELFVAETQEVIKAHPRFMLFATQNPPGLYGGRKVFFSWWFLMPV